jgi:hypothetical protein
MAAVRWYALLFHREGQIGLQFESGPGPAGLPLKAVWPIDANGKVIAELLRDLASELEDAEADRN